MKKLTLILGFLLIGLIGIAQDEIGDTIEYVKNTIVFESGFETIDTIYFEPYNPNEWYYSEWIENRIGDTLTRVQLRISDEGVQEMRVLKYISETKIKIKSDYDSKLKEKKDKKDKDK